MPTSKNSPAPVSRPEKLPAAVEADFKKGLEQGWEIPYAGPAQYAPPPSIIPATEQGQDSDAGARSATSSTNRHFESARRKISDPLKSPHMSAHEVMAILGISKSAVYDHSKLVRASTGTGKVLFTTESVLAVKNSAPE
jgi:hypothetical protein